MIRSLHTSAVRQGRKKWPKPLPGSVTGNEFVKKLELKAPIAPALDNIEVPDSHPLWQFFCKDKKIVRDQRSFDSSTRPWSVAELRRKSFEDLHALWYVCLKERNILLKEERVTTRMHFENQNGGYRSEHDRVGETMVNIRHVLAERYRAFEEVQQVLPEVRAQANAEFDEKYVTADAVYDSELSLELERHLVAYYGFSTDPRTNAGVQVDEKIIEAVKYGAKLKYERYSGATDENGNPIANHGFVHQPKRDIFEQYLMFLANDTTEGVAEALSYIKQYRESNPLPVAPWNAIRVLQHLVEEKMGAAAVFEEALKNKKLDLSEQDILENIPAQFLNKLPKE
ncbi:54S ribosomal protein L4, mitochondrial [Yarrowia lipolytica]|uniref:Large ribosomal subunit protein uL29m n=1 Tax=Yarrowia lipolytica TaxID=4952 RepID=A0A371CED0_YARLL|nr:54S ribosomal protein L4 [Yarrowia lipolytica]RDW28644.1 54S ribosomal protein L4, mitochondrial [Yarrowia lipolytica]RDW41041.1 54S ribosomal protein L4, mitochondrial [Yarrowia lipolytica]RDW44990.1 54S ribosomal protein L4, mitochondrial [Yarrowia lipolytica]RDW54233.1 54S ribosomal protein L4, mitochondrial [Yarrowia lipolytica]